MIPSQPRVFTVLVLLITLALAGCLDDDADVVDESDGDSGPVAASGNETADENGNGTTGGDDGNNTGDNEDPSNGGGDNKTDDGGGDDNETTYFDPGWPEMDTAAIRPGVSIAGGCTANFVFSSPDNRTLYIGTASHCVGGQDINDTVSIEGGHSGTLVYCSWMHTENEDGCPQSDDGLIVNNNDFALVRIDDEDRGEVHPALLHWGGPTAVAGAPSLGDKTLSYGDSKPDPLQPIEGYVILSDSTSFTMYAAAPGIPGDSGSPVIAADGSALGVLIGLGLTPLPGSNLVSNLQNALDFMTQETGLQVELKTWETLNAGLLP